MTGGLFDADLPSGGWDPSGLVKGWAVEVASRRLVRVVTWTGEDAVRAKAQAEGI